MAVRWTVTWTVVLATLPAIDALGSAGTSSSPPKSTSLRTDDDGGKIMRVPWLIVGGGPHGVHVAARLIGEGVTEDLCIIDDDETLLSKWKARTAATGMEYLRSSASYHLDLNEHSLRKFAKKNTTGRRRSKKADKESNMFSGDYERPRLDLFNQHSDAVIDQFDLQEKHIQGTVTKLEPCEDHVRVVVMAHDRDTTAANVRLECIAEQVVLAVGVDNPSYPDWVTEDLLHDGKVRHLLDTKAIIPDLRDSEVSSMAIVGGGITAAHKALQGAKQGITNVHLISRHAFVEQQFDTHQDWMMDQAAASRSEAGGGSGFPKRQQVFRATRCLQERRHIINRERVPGTVTAATNRGRDGLQYAIQNDRVQWHEAEVISLEMAASSRVSGEQSMCKLTLSSGSSLIVDQVFLATGFGKSPPPFIKKLDLPVSEFCGYPVVDTGLRWGHSRVFVTGALAELELGPSARNIAGARLAAERIVGTKSLD